ncbi:MAG: ribulose-phosphate 3-epimerase [Clostridia bacterium]|nr:ribulose-phosphate 3-epimerase [Clostridia bacterium]
MIPAAISPSLMCADIFRLREIIETMEATGIEYLHIDVMDGVFVPNFCLGSDYCRRLKAKTSIPLDLHLMVTAPEKKLGVFPFGPGDFVSVHYESTPAVADALAQIRQAGAGPLLAINPDTPVDAVLPFLDAIDGVLLMTVFPGFAGQSMVPGSLERITALRRLLDENGKSALRIEVDGNVNYEKAPLMRQAGADLFVVGTSSILGPGNLTENIAKMRRVLAEGGSV